MEQRWSTTLNDLTNYILDDLLEQYTLARDVTMKKGLGIITYWRDKENRPHVEWLPATEIGYVWSKKHLDIIYDWEPSYPYVYLLIGLMDKNKVRSQLFKISEDMFEPIGNEVNERDLYSPLTKEYKAVWTEQY